MSKEVPLSPQQQWARFRFAVVSPLLVSPPDPTHLTKRLRQIAGQEWRHPLTGRPTRFGFSTIERWFHQARKDPNPIKTLCRKVRSDAGQCRIIPVQIREALRQQHRAHPSWSYQLHYDNLAALLREQRFQGELPSYTTVRRFMHANDLLRRMRIAKKGTEGTRKAEQRLEQREVRSYEMENVNALWHLDFHHCSRSIPHSNCPLPTNTSGHRMHDRVVSGA